MPQAHTQLTFSVRMKMTSSSNLTAADDGRLIVGLRWASHKLAPEGWPQFQGSMLWGQMSVQHARSCVQHGSMQSFEDEWMHTWVEVQWCQPSWKIWQKKKCCDLHRRMNVPMMYQHFARHQTSI